MEPQEGGVVSAKPGGRETRKSEYKTMALVELNLTNLTEGTSHEGDKNQVGAKRGVEGEAGMGVSQGALLSEIDKVMQRVEETMLDVGDSEGNKRVRRTVETTATEMRSIIKCIEKEEGGMMVEGVRMENRWLRECVRILRGLRSEEEEMKRIDQDKGRLRGVQDSQESGRSDGAGNKDGETSKSPRKVVRRVKASTMKLCTSLTLAPPTMGLPNE